jgi:penicillin-binding protein 1A
VESVARESGAEHRGHPFAALAEAAMRRGLRGLARSALSLVACAAIAQAEEPSAAPESAEIRAAYEVLTADADPVPEMVQQAFVAAEDRDFQRRDAGLSTITRQLAKRVNSPEGGMLSQKLTELSTTRAIAQALEKPEILAWYLHGIYLGRGCYGVKSAALAYFGETPAGLTLAQAALLAALPKAPTLFDPSRNPESARERRNFVLAEMVTAGFVTAERAGAAADAPLGTVEPPGDCTG